MVKHGWSASLIAGLSQSAALQRECKMIDKAFDPVQARADQIFSRQAQRQMRAAALSHPDPQTLPQGPGAVALVDRWN
jgi:hypothetical protein